jgi:hypothetical protein
MAETLLLIPLANTPQTFNITLAGVQYAVTSKWNEFCGWVLDFYDGVSGDSLVANVPLVVGADLFAQYDYLGLPGQAIVYTDGDQYAAPTLENLGTMSNLYLLVDV